MMALRLKTLVLILTLSGFPLESLLCGQGCAPEQANATTDCHEHGKGSEGAPAVGGMHLCDEDGSVSPMVVPSVFALTIVPVESSPAIASFVVHAPRSLRQWESPPGYAAPSIASFEIALRI